jgi:hypothetical protein
MDGVLEASHNLVSVADVLCTTNNNNKASPTSNEYLSLPSTEYLLINYMIGFVIVRYNPIGPSSLLTVISTSILDTL